MKKKKHLKLSNSSSTSALQLAPATTADCALAACAPTSINEETFIVTNQKRKKRKQSKDRDKGRPSRPQPVSDSVLFDTKQPSSSSSRAAKRHPRSQPASHSQQIAPTRHFKKLVFFFLFFFGPMGSRYDSVGLSLSLASVTFDSTEFVVFGTRNHHERHATMRDH